MKEDSKMVRQLQCQVSGCITGGYNVDGVFQAGPYLTDSDCVTVAERSEDLKQHLVMVHELDRLEREAYTRKIEAEIKWLAAETGKFEAETARIVLKQKQTIPSRGSEEHRGDCLHLSVAEVDSQEGDGHQGWCSPMPTGLSPPKDQHLSELAGMQVQGVKHMRCDPRGIWITGPVESHGRVQLSVSICEDAYEILDPPRVPPRSSTKVVSVLADTGAQMCVTGIRVALQLGLKSRDLVPCSLKINGANNSGLEILGAMFVTLSKDGWTTKQMVYVARGVAEFYMSKEACRELGTIGDEFPSVGSSVEPGSRRMGSSSALPPPTSLYGLGTKGEPQWGSGKSSVNDADSVANFVSVPDGAVADDGVRGGAVAVVRTVSGSRCPAPNSFPVAPTSSAYPLRQVPAAPTAPT